MTAPERHYLYLDLGFFSACNLRCAYCRADVVFDDGKFELSRLMAEIDAFQRRYVAACVKLSGYGEVTLWRHFPVALEILSARFPKVQVISNGTFGADVFAALLRHENVSPNLTIDGLALEANYLRTASSTQHSAIHANLRGLVEAGKRVEVNCVLHKDNAPYFEEFCDYLDGFGRGRVLLFPFPVKSFDRARSAAELRCGLEDLAASLDVLWGRYAAILPPRVYGEELRRVLENGARAGPCHVHWANLGSGSRDERLHCANYGEDLSYGPMLDALTDHATAIRREEDAHLRAGGVGPKCGDCYNHFHVINFFLDGRMSLEDLLALPSLDAPGIRAIASAVRREYAAALTAGLA